eukprot:Polyplicarium_translucidae@DN1731_c0_g1_i1.p2
MIEAKSKALSAVRFVDPHVTLATAGASDGVIRLWDIRKPRTAFFAFTSSGSATKAQEDGGSQRGVVWMDVDDLHRHLAVKHTDSRVTVYDARSLAIDSLRALRKCNLHMPISPDRHGGDNSHLKPCLSGCGNFLGVQFSRSGKFSVYDLLRDDPARPVLSFAWPSSGNIDEGENDSTQCAAWQRDRGGDLLAFASSAGRICILRRSGPALSESAMPLFSVENWNEDEQHSASHSWAPSTPPPGAHSLESPRKSTIPHAPFLFSQTSHQASATPRRSVGTSVLCSDEANAPPRPRKKRSLCEG